MRIRRLGSPAALMFFLVAIVVAPFLPAADDPTAPPPVLTLKGHREAVYGVAYSADGRFLVTASGDPSIKVWELPSGKELKSFAGAAGHKGIVLAVALSPDGTQFATGGADNTARVWDFPAAKHLRAFAHDADPRVVAVSADGNRLALGGKDGTIRVWTRLADEQSLTLTGHTGAVTGLAFSPNGTTLVSVGGDGTLRYWNAVDGKPLATVAAHPGAVSAVAFNPGGNVVYTGGPDGTLRFWTPPSTSLRAPLTFKEPVTSLAVAADGSYLAAGSGKGVRTASLSGQTVREFTGASDTVTAAAVAPGGSLVAAGTADRQVLLWEGKDGGKLLARQSAHGGAVTGVSFSPAGNQLATVGKDGMLRLWAVPPAPPRVAPHPDAARAAVLSADGKRLVTGGADKVVRLYRLDALKTPERQFSGHTGAVNAVAVLGADGKLIASTGDDETVRLWSVSRGEQVSQIGAHAGAVTSLVAVGAEQFVTAGADGGVKLWRVPATKDAPRGPLSHAGGVTSFALSADGGKLLTGSADKQVRLWNLAKGQVERTWTGPTLGVTVVALSRAGDRVAAGSADRTVSIWQASSSKAVGKPIALPAAVAAVAFTADGKSLVAGLADGSVRLLDVAGGKQIKALEGHKGAVHALVVTPAGDRALTAGADGVVRVQPLAGGAAAKIDHGSAAHALALSRDGTQVAVGGVDKRVVLYSLATGKAITSLTTPAPVRGLALSGDGKRVAVAGGDNRARVFTVDGRLEEALAHDGPVTAVAFAADGRRVFTGSDDKTVRDWPLSLVWQGRHDGAVRQVVVSPRGDRVLSAGADGTVRLWNLTDGKPAGVIRAHAGAVAGLSLTADAARLVTAGADRAARVWDLAKLAPGKAGGKELDPAAVTIALPAAAQSVAVTPTGTRVAVGLTGEDGDAVRLYDTASGKELLAIGDKGSVSARALAFLADGRTLLAAGDRSPTLLDVNLLAAWEAHPGGASGVGYLGSGTQLVTGGADKTVKLWTLPSGKLERTFAASEAVTAVALARDNTQVAVTAGKTLRLLALADGKETLALDLPSPAAAVAVSADRQKLATAHADGRARVWDVATRREQEGVLHAGGVTGVAFHPNQPTGLVTAGADRAVIVGTLHNSRLVAVGAAVAGIAAAPNSAHVLTAAADGKVRLHNTSSGAVERVCDGGARAQTCVAVARTGQLIAAGGADRKVRLFGYSDGKLLSEFTAPAEPRSLAFTPTGQALVAACGDGTLTAWDTVYNLGQPLPAEFGKALQTYQHGGDATDVAFPNAGAAFYSAGADRSVKSWKLASDAPLRTFNHPGTVNALAYSKDGALLATGGSDGKLRLFDPAKGAQLREVTAHATMNQTAIYAVAFSPDGKQVLTAGVDGTMKLFSVPDGKPVREFRAYKEKAFDKGHQEAVLCAAFSPDGKLVASGGMDRNVKLWDVATGEVVRELVNPTQKPAALGLPMPSHPGWVYALRFADGGKTLVTAGGAPRLHGYVAGWDVASGKFLTGRELDVGTIFALAVAPDDRALAIGTGGSLRAEKDLNLGLIFPLPLR